jgi:hypothetical protein
VRYHCPRAPSAGAGTLADQRKGIEPLQQPRGEGAKADGDDIAVPDGPAPAFPPLRWVLTDGAWA